ncbi:hypothetical protein [Citrobacter rodentium]|uniref:Uncharacterized protein n=2 Tax=Citrobacter rodentium TaxID=67825 RepID=D2TGW1_CITRI|nr:hypothetical protein [Citrobacter rodentium]KIQ52804.1 hypothetical protein TA05_02900 [Citrobacter rodentium]QBY27959.1 hypothetical protein E2R62_03290 [Citrobacter rodentium]UHO30159.1 hypothetical protein K7R23_19535 [Citrobacter rodentium NBRC 105723 = DSM 16636]CBG88124.1 hypothetical protein ROD_13601 [Citrobacter rodentium ICC168]HAT8012472.1 hypothetical protein [Citrobacter rodentium NBRC 105723 = DSM 16636]
MNTIVNFNVLDELGKYDKESNPSKLSVFDLLPSGVSWLYGTKKIEIRDHKKIIPLLLLGDAEVALVRAPFDKDKSQAYILSSTGEIMWDVKEIIEKKIKEVVFYDVYYISDILFFFININGHDYRFSFDVSTGIAGDIIQNY